MKLLRLGAPALVVVLGLLILAVLGYESSFSQDKAREETRAKMRGVFVNLADTYIYSLDAATFEDPANRDKIKEHLRGLAAAAETFESHTTNLDPSFDYMRRSLAYDARDALQYFEMGQYIRTRWVLAKITENCMTCHSKFKSERSFDLGESFIEKAPIQKMAPAARAELQIAMRQFDAGLDTYEQMFRDPTVLWPTLSLAGAFERYLRVCIVVKDEVPRATKALEAYSMRADLDPGAKAMVGTWINDLKRLEKAKPPKNALADASKTIMEAQRAIRYPSDRARLVDFIASTVLLHRFLNEDGHKKEETAEAYYLLAIAESHISTSYWISEADFLLEQAIRTAPKSQVGRDAYDFLVTYITSGHAMAREMPENVTHNLEELRALIAE